MYTPPAFAEHDTETLHAFVDAHPLGALVTHDAERGLLATHLPLLLDRSAGPLGTLRGHLARANAHAATTAREALVLFAGADAYVTPSWYASKAQHGRVVPTWNYVAVHAAGPLQLIDDAEWLVRHVAELSARHEAAHAHPWSVSDAPPEYIEKLARDIVGLEIPIARLDGKWKMSQNRPAADIDGVVAGLAASDAPKDRAVSAIVDARRPASKR